jgi:YVTN family beta-propeller protein
MPDRQFRIHVFLTVLLLLIMIGPVESAFGDPPKLTQIAMVNLPGVPGFDGMAIVGQDLLITQGGAGTLDVFNTVQRRVVRQVAGLGDLQGIAVDGRSGQVYVSNARGKDIAVISMRDWKVVHTIALDTSPYHLAMSSDDKWLFVANWMNQSISKIDTAQNKVVGKVALGGTPRGIVYDPEAHVLWVSLQDVSQIVEIDSNLKILNRYKLLASQPTGLALDPPARLLYIAVRHAVIQFQLGPGVEVRRLAAPAGATSLWLDRPSGTLFVGSGGGDISVMTATAAIFAPVDEVHTEVRGSSVAYDDAHQFIYMPGGRDGRSKLLILKRIEVAQPPTP